MTKYLIEDIKIVIADPNRQLRTSLKGVLGGQGFRGMTDASTVPALEEIVRTVNPDLILCDVHLEDGNVCAMIRKLRHNELGQNPFTSVILFIEEPSEEIVRMASEAGVDDLQVKPVVGQKVVDRIKYLIEKRKPFVVTTDYVGPDRRKNVRPGTQEIPLIEVPNTLASKATGTFSARDLQKNIQDTLWQVNAQKIERHVFQVGYLVDRIVPAYKKNALNAESISMVKRLCVVGQDIVKRLEESDFGHISDLADTLVTVARSLWQSGTKPKSKDLELLPELSAALSATFSMEGSSASVVKKIQSSVQQNYDK